MDCRPDIKILGDSYDPEDIPFKRLWTAVLIQAIVDTRNEDTVIRHGAVYWLESDSQEFNSFINICEILNINFLKLRTKLKFYKEKPNEKG